MQKLIAVVGLALLSSACGGGEEAPAPAAAPADPAAAQQRLLAYGGSLFGDLCASCHGAAGAGDGTLAANLDPKPRDFRQAEWQDAVTDDHIRKVVLEGGEAAGLSAGMAPIPQLAGNEKGLEAVVAFVRSLRL